MQGTRMLASNIGMQCSWQSHQVRVELKESLIGSLERLLKGK